jgi:hypothetical protein
LTATGDAARDLPLLWTPEATILVSQRPSMQGMLVEITPEANANLFETDAKGTNKYSGDAARWLLTLWTYKQWARIILFCK